MLLLTICARSPVDWPGSWSDTFVLDKNEVVPDRKINSEGLHNPCHVCLAIVLDTDITIS